MTAQMVLHCGAHKATYEEVAAVPTPPATDTWFPISHKAVYETATDHIRSAGFAIRRINLALNRGGQQFFATLDLESTISAEVALAIGLRNSVDKSLPMGFIAGHRVFCCDNLAFSAELMIVRKHTRFGMDRFREAMALAAGKIGEFQVAEKARLEFMRKLPVNNTEAESLILQAWEKKIISNRHLEGVLGEWRQPKHQEFEPRTRWSLFNAFTSVLNSFTQSNPRSHAARTFDLNALMAPPNEGPPAANLSQTLNEIRAETADNLEGG